MRARDPRYSRSPPGARTRTASWPSAPNPKRLGGRVNWSMSPVPCPCEEFECEEDGGGVDAEKWRSERVRGRYRTRWVGGTVRVGWAPKRPRIRAVHVIVLPQVLRGFLQREELRGARGPALGLADALPLALLVLVLVLPEAEEAPGCALRERGGGRVGRGVRGRGGGGRGAVDREERSRCAGDCRKHGSLDAAVGDVSNKD
ncbi:hypothetical protein C8R44DRAFT_890106 [Mycena epipterygia]|nr:hypothetical protein C8R44DRAFT_890106 [Mycena epipterygia]